jgi:cytochrome P450
MDRADTDQFLVWTEAFFNGYGGDPEAEAQFAEAIEGLNTYWVDAIAERRERSLIEGDFCSYCVHTKLDDGRYATDGELIELMTLMVIGGLDTVRSQLSYLVWHLARHPEDRKRLIDEPEVIPYAVEETLRFYGMTFGDGRKVTRDVEFHGVKLKKGETVWALNSSANRDPKHFERANEYIIDRKKNQHTTFALGRHRCLGMHLARAEMKIATEEWLAAIPDFWIDSHEPLMERGAGSMLSLTDLPLAWSVKS